jgi:hypothetical protein
VGGLLGGLDGASSHICDRADARDIHASTRRVCLASDFLTNRSHINAALQPRVRQWPAGCKRLMGVESERKIDA